MAEFMKHVFPRFVRPIVPGVRAGIADFAPAKSGLARPEWVALVVTKWLLVREPVSSLEKKSFPDPKTGGGGATGAFEG